MTSYMELSDPLRFLREKAKAFGIAAEMDRVKICGQVVMRPATISPAQWLEFWEKIQ